MERQLILTSKLGTFTFKKGTSLSLAKLVRDTVIGQWFAPKPGEVKLKDAGNCYAFIRNHPSALLADTEFVLRIN